MIPVGEAMVLSERGSNYFSLSISVSKGTTSRGEKVRSTVVDSVKARGEELTASETRNCTFKSHASAYVSCRPSRGAKAIPTCAGYREYKRLNSQEDRVHYEVFSG